MFPTVTLRLLALAVCGGLATTLAPWAAAQAPQAGPAAGTEPQLRLERMEGGESVPDLRPSPELGTQPATDGAQRDAAAALWMVLRKTPEQGVQDALRLENAERELRSLQAAAQQNAATVAEMRAQVERARTDRSAAVLVMALSVLLAAILTAMAWRWYREARMARVGRWFEAQGTAAAAAPGGVPLRERNGVHEPVEPTLADTRSVRAIGHAQPAAPPVKAAGVPPAGTPIVPPASAAPVAATSPVAAASPASPTRGNIEPAGDANVRMVGVEELIDVQEKADFFLSINEPEQAVSLLEEHIQGADTSALAWLELLELYHRLGRRTEFERVRADFRQKFTGEVPDFDHFDQPTPSLEYYARALSRIVALWPAPRVLAVIEESIFRKPGLPGTEPFTLQAYRELVLLYHVARDMADTDEDDAHSSDTALQPLNALELIERAPPDPLPRGGPPPGHWAGVDIELGGDDAARDLPPLDFDLSGSEAAQALPSSEKPG